MLFDKDNGKEIPKGESIESPSNKSGIPNDLLSLVTQYKGRDWRQNPTNDKEGEIYFGNKNLGSSDSAWEPVSPQDMPNLIRLGLKSLKL